MVSESPVYVTDMIAYRMEGGRRLRGGGRERGDRGGGDRGRGGGKGGRGEGRRDKGRGGGREGEGEGEEARGYREREGERG